MKFTEIKLLVLGYGNDLRSDDGVGPRVAELVAAWNLPGVQTLAFPLLTPEFAEAVAAARAVIFVDASVDGEGGQIQVRPVHPAHRRTAIGHSGTPEELVALAESIYGARPTASLVTIPASDLGFGEELSAVAQEGVAQALRHIRQWISEESHRA